MLDNVLVMVSAFFTVLEVLMLVLAFVNLALVLCMFDEVPVTPFEFCDACLILLAEDLGLFLSVLFWVYEFLLSFLSSNDLKKVLLGVFPL